MMDKVQVFTVGVLSDCGHIDFDTDVCEGVEGGDVHDSSIVSV
jgi:hypothetical protein